MRTDIARLDLHNRRHLTSAYTIGMALYMLVIVVLYPSFRHSSELNSLSSGKLAALFGVSGPLTSPAGWVNANAYTNFLPLIMLLLTIGYGAAAIAGQDDDGIAGAGHLAGAPRHAFAHATDDFLLGLAHGPGRFFPSAHLGKINDGYRHDSRVPPGVQSFKIIKRMQQAEF